MGFTAAFRSIAYEHLKEALIIRENSYKNNEKYATDVAWTSFN